MKAIFTSIIVALTFQSYAQNTVLSEDFESGIPSSWKVVTKDQLTVDNSVAEYTEAWINVEDPFDTAILNHCASSTSFFTTVGNANRWLITPAITLADMGNVLTFNGASFDPSFPDNYAIKYGTDINDLDNFETLVTVIAETPYWSTHSFVFDTLGVNNQTIYIAFVNVSDNGHKLYIDDVKFETEVNVSTENIDLPIVSIYPNPASETIIVENGHQSLKKLYDITGNLILSTYEDIISVESINDGIYFLEMDGMSQKIIIKH